jgi:hypothetical protein
MPVGGTRKKARQQGGQRAKRAIILKQWTALKVLNLCYLSKLFFEARISAVFRPCPAVFRPGKVFFAPRMEARRAPRRHHFAAYPEG